MSINCIAVLWIEELVNIYQKIITDKSFDFRDLIEMCKKVLNNYHYLKTFKFMLNVEREKIDEALVTVNKFYREI